MTSSLQARARSQQKSATANPSPFSRIVPDCVYLIFEYHLQPVTAHMQQSLSKKEIRFCATHMRNWDFEPDTNVQAFFESMASYPKRGPPISIEAKCNKSLSDFAFPHFRGVKKLNICGWGLYSRSTLITDEAFTNLRGIEKLDMSHNHSSSITDQAFTNLRGIKELDCSWCYQHTITDCAFENLRGIRHLKMEGMHQEGISNEAMKSLRGIRSLYISSFSHITEEAFENLRGIKELRMRNSSILEKEEFFKNLRGIEKLTLGCSLNYKEDHTLNPQVFKNLRGIQELDVSGYHLDKNGEQAKMFEQIRGIKTLKMRGQITVEQAKHLRGIKNVQSVHCRHILDMLRVAENLRGATFCVSATSEEHAMEITM